MQIHIHSPYQLPRSYPDFGCQVDFIPFGGYHLTIGSSPVVSLLCQKGLLSLLGSSDDTDGFRGSPINNSKQQLLLSHHTPRNVNCLFDQPQPIEFTSVFFIDAFFRKIQIKSIFFIGIP